MITTMETARQQKERINNLLNSIPKNTEDDKSKIYSWKSIINKNLLEPYNQNMDKGYKVQWCEECQSFTCHFGKCRTCNSKKYGLGNPEIHAKTIKTQIENGTFNMLNPEVQKNKISNQNIKYKHINYFCNNCKKETKHRIWPDGKIRCCRCDFQNNGMKIKFCDTCKENTLHNGEICIKCNPEAKSGTYPNFTSKDDIPYYFDNSINHYIPWEDFKQKFENNNLIQNQFIQEIQKDYPNSFIQTTFRTQDSEDWSGSKSAFEQNLVEKGVTWFVYIKFYIYRDNNISNDNVKPLVVGKTGSMLVNECTDVSFSEDINHGPARRFLSEQNLNWDKTKILVIPCNNENEAYLLEAQIYKKYNLFES